MTFELDLTHNSLDKIWRTYLLLLTKTCYYLNFLLLGGATNWDVLLTEACYCSRLYGKVRIDQCSVFQYLGIIKYRFILQIALLKDSCPCATVLLYRNIQILISMLSIKKYIQYHYPNMFLHFTQIIKNIFCFLYPFKGWHHAC